MAATSIVPFICRASESPYAAQVGHPIPIAFLAMLQQPPNLMPLAFESRCLPSEMQTLQCPANRRLQLMSVPRVRVCVGTHRPPTAPLLPLPGRCLPARVQSSCVETLPR